MERESVQIHCDDGYFLELFLETPKIDRKILYVLYTTIQGRNFTSSFEKGHEDNIIHNFLLSVFQHEQQKDTIKKGFDEFTKDMKYGFSIIDVGQTPRIDSIIKDSCESIYIPVNTIKRIKYSMSEI